MDLLPEQVLEQVLAGEAQVRLQSSQLQVKLQALQVQQLAQELGHNHHLRE